MINEDSKIFEKILALVEERSYNYTVETVFKEIGFSITQHDSSHYLFKNTNSSISGELYFSSFDRLVRCITYPTKDIYNKWKHLAKSLPEYNFMLNIANSPSKFTKITFQKIFLSKIIVSFHIGDMRAF